MSSPHKIDQVKWLGLADHFALDGISIVIRTSSVPQQRHQALVDFALSLCSAIITCAKEKISALPMHNASPVEWHTAGVDDEQLFPTELLDSMELSDIIQYGQLKAWNKAGVNTVDLVAIVTCALTANPENPYVHLPSLIRIAQCPHSEIFDLQFRSAQYAQYGWPTYACWTLGYYMYINLLLTLGGPECLDGNRCFLWPTLNRARQPIGRYVVFPQNIWRDGLIGDEKTRSAYMERCFGFLVSWYAISLEATRCNLPVSSLDDLTVEFNAGDCDLVVMIFKELRLISPSMTVPGTINAHVHHSMHREGMVQVQSLPTPTSPPPLSFPFSDLPPELQIRILSFIHPRNLLPLTTVNQMFRNAAITVLYADPLSAIIPDDPWSIPDALGRATPFLFKTFASHSRYAAMVQQFRFLIPSLDCWNNSIAETVGIQLAPFLPSTVSAESTLKSLYLYVPSEFVEATATATGRISVDSTKYKHGLYELAGLLPGLETLHIASLPGQFESLSIDRSPREHSYNMVLWTNLKHLSLDFLSSDQQPLYPRMYTAVVASSANSLVSLVLQCKRILRISMNTFPVCPNVRELVIESDGKHLGELLKGSFPAVTSLCIRGDVEVDDSVSPVDLQRAAPQVEHLSLVEVEYNLLFPASLRSLFLQDYVYHDGDIPGSDSLEALSLKDIGEAGYFKEAAALFPNLKSIEYTSDWLDLEDMSYYATVLANSLPHVETAVFLLKMSTQEWRYGDPIGIEEPQMAEQFFKACDALKVVGFSGIPDPSQPVVGEIPSRLWERVVEGEVFRAKMVGREALKWKLSEYWRNIVDSVFL